MARPITLVLGNARCQRCAMVEQFARRLDIELLFLPAYSPNLNLIERLWRFVKKTVLNSRPRGSCSEFRLAMDQCLATPPTTYQPEIKSCMTHRLHTFYNVSHFAA
jgi:hypothetical protein